MHTRFEYVSEPKEGYYCRVDGTGKMIWERPRTKREAGMFWMPFIVGAVFTAVPLTIALVFMLT